MELTLTADIAEIPRLLDGVEAFAAAADLVPGVEQKLALCLDEAVTNIIMHGAPSGPILVQLDQGPDGKVTARVEDDGPAYDPTSAADPDHLLAELDDRPIGGLGIHLIRKMMDSVDYSYADGRNRLTLSIGG